MFKIILFAIAIAFFLVKRYQWHIRFKLNRKPFNCMGCVSGWAAMGLSWDKGWEIPFIGLVAVMAGSIFENTFNRYL